MKYFFLSSVLALVLATQLKAQIPGTVAVSAPVAPPATNSPFGSTDTRWAKGGYGTWATNYSQLTNINWRPSARKQVGEQQYVAGSVYQLGPDLVTWTKVEGNTPQQFGAKGDGTTDDSAAFVAAFAASRNGTLYIPPGSYKLRPYVGMSQYSTSLGAVFGTYDFVMSVTNVNIVGIGNPTITLDRNTYVTDRLGFFYFTGNCSIDGVQFVFPQPSTVAPAYNLDVAVFSGTSTNDTARVTVKNSYFGGGYTQIRLNDYIESASITESTIACRVAGGTNGGAYGIFVLDPNYMKNINIADCVITNDVANTTGADAVIFNVDNISGRLTDTNYWRNLQNFQVDHCYIGDFTGHTSAFVQGGLGVAGPVQGMIFSRNTIRNTKNAIWCEWLYDDTAHIALRSDPWRVTVTDNDIEFTHRGISIESADLDERDTTTGYTNNVDRLAIVSNNRMVAASNNYMGFKWGMTIYGNAVVKGNQIIGTNSPVPSDHTTSVLGMSGVTFRGGDIVFEGNTVRGWDNGMLLSGSQQVDTYTISGNQFVYNAASYRVNNGGNAINKPVYNIYGNSHDGNKSLFLSDTTATRIAVRDEWVVGELIVENAWLRSGAMAGYGIEEVSGLKHGYFSTGVSAYWQQLGAFAGQDMRQDGTPARYLTTCGNASYDGFYMNTNAFQYMFTGVAGDPYVTSVGGTNFPSQFRPGTFVQFYDGANTHFYTNTFVIAVDPANSRWYLSTNCPASFTGMANFPIATLGGGRIVDGTLTVNGNVAVAGLQTITSTNGQANLFTLNTTSMTDNHILAFKSANLTEWYLGVVGSTKEFLLADTNNVPRMSFGRTTGVEFNSSTSLDAVFSASATNGHVALQFQQQNTNWWSLYMHESEYSLIMLDRLFNRTFQVGQDGKTTTIGLVTSNLYALNSTNVNTLTTGRLTSVGMITASAGLKVPIAFKSSNFTVSTNELALLVDPTLGSITVALPPAATYSGQVYMLMNTAPASLNTVTIDPDGAETINNAATRVVTNACQVISYGTGWWTLSSN
jgi:hypothetical protein